MQQFPPDGVPPLAVKCARRNTIRVFAVALLAAAVALFAAQFHGLDVQIQSPADAAPADLQAALRADSVAVARVYDANTADAPHVYPVLWQARHGKVLWQARHGKSYRTDIFDTDRDAVVSGLRSSALRPGVIALQPGSPPRATYRGYLADLLSLGPGATLAVLCYLIFTLIFRRSRNPLGRYGPAVIAIAAFLVVVGVGIANHGNAPDPVHLRAPSSGSAP